MLNPCLLTEIGGTLKIVAEICSVNLASNCSDYRTVRKAEFVRNSRETVTNLLTNLYEFLLREILYVELILPYGPYW